LSKLKFKFKLKLKLNDLLTRSIFFMKNVYFLFGLLFVFACQPTGQEQVSTDNDTSSTIVDLATKLQVDTSLFETFEMAEGDTSYLMKKYFIVFLKEGPNRSQGKEEAAKIQEAHLKHMDRLANEKKICIAGPFADDGDIRGLVIYSASSLEEAKWMTGEDPAVKAGRLLVEVHPFWAAVGSGLF